MAKKIRTHRDLEVYQKAFEAAMQIFELTKSFPQGNYSASEGRLRTQDRWTIRLTEPGGV